MLGRLGGLLVISLAGVACIPSMEGQAAGLIGCRESDIVISDEDSSLATETWIATCNEKRYVCSRSTMGTTAYSPACSPEISETAATAPERGSSSN